MDAFGAYARYYDLLYRDKDYAAEARYVHGLIQSYCAGANSILELGCGTGAHAEEFARLGYEVLGVDTSATMLMSAEARHAKMTPEAAAMLDFCEGDVRSFRTHRRFDAVTALFHVLSYQVTDEDLTAMFTTAALHLVPGGVFVFDCWYGPAVLADRPVARTKTLEDSTTRVQRAAKPTMIPDQNMVEVDYQVQVSDLASGEKQHIRETHKMRYLFESELLEYSKATGMSSVHLGAWMADAPASEETWNVVMVARKPTEAND